MAKMNSKYKYMYDAAPSVALVPRDAPQQTISQGFEPIKLDELDGYWNEDGYLADQTFAVAVNVTEVTITDGGPIPVYLGFTDGVEEILTQTVFVSSTGQFVFLVDIDTVKAGLPTATEMYIATGVEDGGIGATITLYSWIAGAIIR